MLVRFLTTIVLVFFVLIVSYGQETEFDLSIHEQALNTDEYHLLESYNTANYYKLDVSVQPGKTYTIVGTMTLRYTNNNSTTLDDLIFRLYPSSLARFGWIDVTDIMVDGTTVDASFEQDNTIMQLSLSEPLQTGDSREIEMSFITELPTNFSASVTRFAFYNDVLAATNYYPMLSVYDDTNGWWITELPFEGDLAFSEIAWYDVTITLPSSMRLAATGVFIEQTDNTDGTTTYRDITGPVRDHVFQASDRYEVVSQTVNQTEVSVYYFADTTTAENALNVLEIATTALDTFSDLFGNYPYLEYDLLMTEVGSGIEWSGLVQLGGSVFSEENEDAWILIAHETAHQWFFSMAGNDVNMHPWLDEALASYSETVFARRFFGDSEAEAHLQTRITSYLDYLDRGGEDLDAGLTVLDYPDRSMYFTIVYHKPQVFFQELEALIGSDAVEAGLQLYFECNQFGIGQPADFRVALETVANQDLGDLFAEYIGDIPATSSCQFNP